jgi:arsenite methyltransferase
MTKGEKKSDVESYESCIFDQWLGETLRPGGLELTARVAEIGGIGQNHTVLDIGCGKGTTAIFLCEKHNCRVIGIDLSDKMISFCRSKIRTKQLIEKMSFILGDGESLPFSDSSFDTVISECSFSLFLDKERAANEIGRVLKTGGKLLMTDIILRGEVSEDSRSQIGFPCCMAGAQRIEEYISLFARIGLKSTRIEDHSPELEKLIYYLGVTFGPIDDFLSRLPAGPCQQKRTIKESSSSIESFWNFIEAGRPGYALIAMTKE